MKGSGVVGPQAPAKSHTSHPAWGVQPASDGAPLHCLQLLARGQVQEVSGTHAAFASVPPRCVCCARCVLRSAPTCAWIFVCHILWEALPMLQCTFHSCQLRLPACLPAAACGRGWTAPRACACWSRTCSRAPCCRCGSSWRTCTASPSERGGWGVMGWWAGPAVYAGGQTEGRMQPRERWFVGGPVSVACRGGVLVGCGRACGARGAGPPASSCAAPPCLQVWALGEQEGQRAREAAAARGQVHHLGWWVSLGNPCRAAVGLFERMRVAGVEGRRAEGMFLP